MSALPKGWVETTLADAVVDGAAIIYGILQPGPDLPDGIPYVRPTEIQNGTIAVKELRRTASDIAERYSRSKLEADDLILSIVGTIGKVAVVPAEIRGANITQSSCRIRANQNICVRDWMKYFLTSPLANKYYDDSRLGTAVPRLNLEDVRLFLLPLPPLAEQKRIVAKLDTLNAKSTRARTELARIETLVARYKQAVLGKAFSGELFVADTANWVHTTLGELAVDVRYGTAEKCTYAPELTPVLRIPNVANGRIDLSDLKHAEFNEKEIRKLALVEGDLLVIRSNGSIDLVGRSAVVDKAAAGMLFAGYLIRIRFDLRKANPTFIQFWMQSAEVRNTIEGDAKSTSGVNNVNSQQLQALTLSLPPLSEQHEIVRRIETAFAKIDRLATEAKRALELLGKLDEAILAKAFRGELVPQDAADEPAEQLLARIRAEREAAPKGKRGRGKRT